MSLATPEDIERVEAIRDRGASDTFRSSSLPHDLQQRIFQAYQVNGTAENTAQQFKPAHITASHVRTIVAFEHSEVHGFSKTASRKPEPGASTKPEAIADAAQLAARYAGLRAEAEQFEKDYGVDFQSVMLNLASALDTAYPSRGNSHE